MSYRDVLKIFKLERELTDDETALLNTLRGMTDAERELLVESLSPPAKASKPATKKLKRCDVCGVSKRAAHHRDTSLPDYHEFDPGGKSKRASSLKQAIAGTAGKSKISSDDFDDSACDQCSMKADDNIHHLLTAEGFHEFQPGQAQAVSGD